ncbi:MAG: DUF4838 domain-containing protein [Clostridia bacterium]|nr:DUF4838 domain-containing protein [Clostridia bacterium]
MKRILCLLLTLAFVLPMCSCLSQGTEPTADDAVPPLREGGMRLAVGGESNYRVVIAADASEDVKKIAEEFVSYFERITSAKLDVVTDQEEVLGKEIVIGKTTRKIDAAVDYSALGEEGYTYQTQDENLLLTGNTDRAVAYAVYGFLEDRLGVRYWTPDYETVPQKDVLDVAKKISVTETPLFWYRDMGEIGHNDPKWMVKMRLNSRQSLGSENYRKNPFVGGGQGYADWFVHTIGKLAEMEKNESGNFFNVQPCLTDENVYQTVLKNVRKWMELYPDATVVSISQNDGTDESAMCDCKNCTAIYEAHGHVQSAKWIWFVSKVANELKDEYPNLHFETLAYNFTTMAPSGLEIPDNVIVRATSAFACMNHPYGKCGKGKSGPEKSTAKFYNSLLDWSELCDNVFIWDYSTLFHNHWAPTTAFEALRQNMNLYAKNGVKGVYMQGGDNNVSFGEMRAYLTAKLLWDPAMEQEEFDELMEEFMEHYYGEGTSEPLTEYINLYNDFHKDQHFHLYGRLFVDTSYLLVREEKDGTHLDTTFIDQMKACFDRAEEAVTDPVQKEHLRKARVQVKFYELLALLTLEEEYEDAVFDLEYRRALAHELHEDVIACGFTNYSENVGIPKTINPDNNPKLWHQTDAE